MAFFHELPLVPPDPILGLNRAFQDDPKAQVNLGIGAYKTADLKSYVLPSVREAEKRLLGLDKEYLPIEGDAAFIEQTLTLTLGEKDHSRFFGSAALGGTSALRVGGAFLCQHISPRLVLPDPTWDNHLRIFTHAGFEVSSYPYYDKETKGFDFEAMCAALANLTPGTVVLLHSCCQNPTGCDPTPSQWETLATLMQERQLFPFFDCAYQGFGESLEADRSACQLFIKKGLQFLVALSYSKNFGLYGERVGALLAICQNSDEAKRVGSHLKTLIRGLYSNPPCHGQRIVATILADPLLRKQWEQELADMRLRIAQMRFKLISALETLQPQRDFSFLRQQRGMFLYLGLQEHQVLRLIHDHGIYLPANGRISLPSLNESNISYVAKAIANC